MPTGPAHDEEMSAIYRRYTLLRERLQPYLAAAAREPGASGLPIVRPLVFSARWRPSASVRTKTTTLPAPPRIVTVVPTAA